MSASVMHSDMPASPGWTLGLWWVLGTTLAFGLGGPLGVALSRSDNIIVTGAIALSLSVLLSGLAQYLVLRQYVEGVGGWILASLAAVAVVGVLVFGVGLLSPDIGWVLGVSCLGVVLGLAQASILSRMSANAAAFALASTFAWLVAMPAAGIIGASTGASWAIVGGVYSLICAPVLVWALSP